MIHQIVMGAFVGPCPADHETNHKDGNKQNNRLRNLEYLTRLENARHARQVLGHQVGETHPMSKLTGAQVRAILASTMPTRALAREYG
ncbi:MAG: HNH endonuclease, partial [Candidatus Marinimicrobia bacterium]|nr:HNH endonuclease [Candidatus Neomarinimicrobiota bacterium]